MTVTDPKPSVPQQLKATVASWRQVELSWEDSRNEKGYRVERRTLSGTDFFLIGSSSADVPRFIDYGVDPGIDYEYRVVATSAAGSSEPSNLVKVSILVAADSPMFHALAGGRSHSLIAPGDGLVWAWGKNTYGQVGNGISSGPW